ncbi:GOLPH3/VPS74 family protein [Nocardioides nanhaiensis]|uniref:GPP34 family phosphoprotein n=1 Tax=Nocardioides nanhaiensis TaxID=1476871 RepID=A0ABP8WD52_9ACTN
MPPETTSLVDDLVVTGVVPSSGKLILGDNQDLLLEAALVVDLARAGRVTVTGAGVDTRVHVVDAQPVAHPVLREALAWLHATTGPPGAQDLAELEAAGWVTRRVVGWIADRQGSGATLSGAFQGFKARDRVRAHLLSTGTLVARDRRVLGMRLLRRYRVHPPERREDLVVDLREVLLGEREPDQRTGPLLGLLGVANLFASSLNGAAHLARWAPRPRREEASERAHQLARTDGDVDGVRAVIEAVEVIIDERNEKRANSGS